MSPRKSSELSRDAVVDRALEIADTDGIAAITIRRIAQEFGVTPMALYWHFANKDELLDAMGDRLFDALGPVPTEGDWGDQLQAATSALVGVMRAHPGSAYLAAPRIMACEAGRDLAEHALSLLREQGFTVQQSADIARHAMQTAIMLVAEEAGGEHAVPAEEREAHRQAKRAALAALPPDRYPNLVAAAPAMTDCEDVAGYYEFGVELFVRGVRGMHAALVPA